MRALRTVLPVVGLLLLSINAWGAFHWTATADPRQYDVAFDAVLAAIQAKVGGLGAFHVSPGDIDPPANIRAKIDARFGVNALWYPGVGNHEAETAADMTWIRDEYTVGHSGRPALKFSTNQDGPAGCVETNYSWDYENVHFVQLNQYWNGGTAAGSDVATQGDIVPQLYNWLAANLAATIKPVIIVFGHEPAYPQNRHVGDSLDQYPANRDAFWNLLESDTRVKAFVVGHTHVYSRHRQPAGRVWQIDLGNAGNDTNGDGKTFLDCAIDDTTVRFDIYRDGGTGSYTLAQSWSVPVNEPTPLEVSSPAQAKLQTDGALVKLSGVVTASYQGYFYVEDLARTSGIRVDEVGYTATRGNLLTITGVVSTTGDGERSIDATYIVHWQTGQVKPLGIVGKSAGGGDYGYDLSAGVGQRGTTDGAGLNNIALLSRFWGRVTYSGPDYFYLDDGSARAGEGGRLGIKVLTYGAAVPDEGAQVSFTGISACYRGGETVYPLVRYVSGLPSPPGVSYNDCVYAANHAANAPNVTTFGIGSGYSGPTSGPLKDISTGAETGVTVTLTQGGGVIWQPDLVTGGGNCDPGTDAANVFNPTLSLQGVIYYGSTGWYVDVEFSGLNLASRYEFVTTANRKGGSSYLNRLTKYTISGADSFTNTSTSGVTITDAGASSTFPTGENTATGYVARWTDINPGADGKFKVRAQAGSAVNQAYSFDAFRLTEL